MLKVTITDLKTGKVEYDAEVSAFYLGALEKGGARVMRQTAEVTPAAALDAIYLASVIRTDASKAIDQLPPMLRKAVEHAEQKVFHREQ